MRLSESQDISRNYLEKQNGTSGYKTLDAASVLRLEQHIRTLEARLEQRFEHLEKTVDQIDRRARPFGDGSGGPFERGRRR